MDGNADTSINCGMGRAFIAALGTFYWARGIGFSIVAGAELLQIRELLNP